MSFRNVALAAAAALVLAGTARADVIYHFQQVGPAMGGPFSRTALVDVSGEIVVTDGADRNGFSFTFLNTYPNAGDRSIVAGLIGLQINEPDFFDQVTLASFQFDRGQYAQYDWGFTLVGGNGAGLLGRIFFNDGNAQLALTFTGTSFTGRIGDEGYACAGVTCTFGGTVTTAIPEPASMALFGVGLLGLAAVRRKRSA